MSFYLSAALSTLRGQINAAFPGRSKTADGWIGDQAHSARVSDHNPLPSGEVCALDVTHDPRSGCDAAAIAAAAILDSRTKYVIFRGRIWSRLYAAQGWRTYTGSNPHAYHVHISVYASMPPSAWNLFSEEPMTPDDRKWVADQFAALEHRLMGDPNRTGDGVIGREVEAGSNRTIAFLSRVVESFTARRADRLYRRLMGDPKRTGDGAIGREFDR